MNFGRYRFSPPWWGVLLFCVGAVVFGSLGVWQIQRAHYKQALVAQARAARAAGPGTITAKKTATAEGLDAAAFDYGRNYVAHGRFDPGHQILLSDQLHATQTGYRVWTPLVLDNGVRVMVDRGWIPRPTSGSVLPDPGAPSERVRVTGYWTHFPQPALSWQTSSCAVRDWPHVLSYPDAAAVRCQYDSPVLDGLLLLDPQAPDGFVRDWKEDKDTIGLRPFAHYAYASQWFLMALAAGVILVVVNVHKR